MVTRFNPSISADRRPATLPIRPLPLPLRIEFWCTISRTSSPTWMRNSYSSLQALAVMRAASQKVSRLAKPPQTALIAARADDGLNADVPYTPGSGPGVWQPTPPNFPAPVTPWLGKMRPFTMRSADQFLPEGPTPLSSEEWVADYNLTRLYGGAANSNTTCAPLRKLKSPSSGW